MSEDTCEVYEELEPDMAHFYAKYKSRFDELSKIDDNFFTILSSLKEIIRDHALFDDESPDVDGDELALEATRDLSEIFEGLSSSDKHELIEFDDTFMDVFHATDHIFNHYSETV